MLVYFGAIFLTTRILGTPELSAQVVNWNSTFVMADGTIDTLANLAKPYRDKITADMQRLKLSGLVTTARQNLFIRVPSSTVHACTSMHIKNTAARKM